MDCVIHSYHDGEHSLVIIVSRYTGQRPSDICQSSGSNIPGGQGAVKGTFEVVITTSCDCSIPRIAVQRRLAGVVSREDDQGIYDCAAMH